MAMKSAVFLLSIAISACSCGKGTTRSTGPGRGGVTVDTTFQNPLLPSGPDPWVLQNDTTYYYMNTLGNRLAIWPTNTTSPSMN